LVTAASLWFICPANSAPRARIRAQLRAEGFTDFPGYVAHLEKHFPLQLEGEPIPRISEGALCRNDSALAQVWLAVFRVSRAQPDRP